MNKHSPAQLHDFKYKIHHFNIQNSSFVFILQWWFPSQGVPRWEIACGNRFERSVCAANGPDHDGQFYIQKWTTIDGRPLMENWSSLWQIAALLPTSPLLAVRVKCRLLCICMPAIDRSLSDCRCGGGAARRWSQRPRCVRAAATGDLKLGLGPRGKGRVLTAQGW